MLSLLGQVSPTLEGLGPFVAFGSLAMLVIAGLSRAFMTQRQENKELNDRVFLIVEKVAPLLDEVATTMRESTRTVEQAGREVSAAMRDMRGRER